MKKLSKYSKKRLAGILNSMKQRWYNLPILLKYLQKNVQNFLQRMCK